MSQGPFHPPPYDPQEPIEAEIVDPRALPGGQASGLRQPDFPAYPPPPRRQHSKLVLVFMGLGLLSLLFLCGGVGYSLYVALSGEAQPTVEEQALLARTFAEDTVELVAALDGKWHVDASHANHREVRRLLRDLERASESYDSEAIENLVDWPAHMLRFSASYRFPIESVFDRIELNDAAKRNFDLPDEASDFRICHIVEQSPDVLYVYTYAGAGTLQHCPYLFHVRRAGGVWKLVDWCEIPERMWESEKNGLGVGPTQGDLEGDGQRYFVEVLVQSDPLIDEGTQQEAADVLRRAEGIAGLPALRNQNLHLLAVRWYLLNDNAEAKRLLEQSVDADAYPWVHHLAAKIAHDERRYDDALAAIGHYERTAGTHQELTLLKLQCQVQLKQTAAAAETALAIVRYAPEDFSHLWQVLAHIPSDRLPELMALLPPGSESRENLARAARRLLYDEKVDEYQAVRDYVASQAPGTSTLLSLDAQLLHYRGELEKALAKHQEIIDLAEDEESRSAARYQYVTLALELYRPLEVYERSNERREILELLVDEIEYGDGLITMPQLAPLVARHRELEPDDPNLPWYAAMVAIDQQAWPTALEEITRALGQREEAVESQDDDGEEDYRTTELKRRLLEVRCELGQALDAYRDAEDADETYRTLAANLERRQDWQTLRALSALHSPRGDDLWVRYYQLRSEEAEAMQAQDARRWGSLLNAYRHLLRDNESSETIYPYYLESRIEELSLEHESWQAVLANDPEAETQLPTLLARLKREGDRQAVQEFLAEVRVKFPENDLAFSEELNTLWEARDFRGVVQRLKDWNWNQSNQFVSQYVWPERIVLSHLALGEADEAREVIRAQENLAHLQLAVLLAAGDAAGLRTHLAEHADELYLTIPVDAEWLRVPAIATFVGSEAYRELREEFPHAVEATYVSQHGLVFFPQVMTWTPESIRTRLAHVGLGDVTVQALPQPPLVRPTFRLQTTGGAYLVSCGGEPFGTVNQLQRENGYIAPAFGKAFESHQSWVAINPGGELLQDNDAMFFRILAALSEEGSALWASPAEVGRLAIPLTPALSQKLIADPVQLRAMATTTSSVWISYWMEDDEHAWTATPWRARCQEAARGGASGRIKVRLARGSAREEHWLELVRVIGKPWGNYEIVGRLEAASILEPSLSAGDVAKFTTDEILAWEK